MTSVGTENRNSFELKNLWEFKVLRYIEILYENFLFEGL